MDAPWGTNNKPIFWQFTLSFNLILYYPRGLSLLVDKAQSSSIFVNFAAKDKTLQCDDITT